MSWNLGAVDRGLAQGPWSVLCALGRNANAELCVRTLGVWR